MSSIYLKDITRAISVVRDFSNDIIEATIIKYVCDKLKKSFCYCGELRDLKDKYDLELLSRIKNINFPIKIDFLINFFEVLLEKNNITEKGIVFTPRYIADYINRNLLEQSYIDMKSVKIIDPGCGCGVFLISAIDFIKEKYNFSVRKIIESSIYGIELDPDNARRCKIILNLYTIISGEKNDDLKINIICSDSLKFDWCDKFNCNGFDCIVGNPPYVNPHNMSYGISDFLKKNFETTKSGTFNIYYAFVEHGMKFLSKIGKLSYIVPNNFLTIKSAITLREKISKNKWLEKIIDFSNNMLFKPIRTYNCIIQLSKNSKETFDYYVMKQTNDIENELKKCVFNSMKFERLNVNGWKLVDSKTLNNIDKIESQSKAIKEFVKTGIATLKDDVYIVNYDGENYYKEVDGEKFEIESTLIRNLYKIPELKKKDIKSACKFIIFPYKIRKVGFNIISENELKEKTPKTYRYLLKQKDKLDARDKGKKNKVAWYAYGRTQGLSQFGRKLLFPTFSEKPKFTMVDDNCAFFCNGYAVFENDYIELDILQRILNSKIMQYYVSNTSYAIEGGYYCYQKKYIENFSIPNFSLEDKKKILKFSKNELDDFLLKIYKLDIEQ